VSYLKVFNATKRFGPSFVALNNVSIEVEKGEFFTLLGPSGCGKTTLLRSIAGFTDLSAGDIELAGKNLRIMPPHKRDIGMVFQDYAVFPHLSVFDNVAFGLKARKIAASEIKRRVGEALEAVRLTALAERLPSAMSGGQQQRIGLARAMVIKPKLLLMDEPLSNLDAKLRVSLREEIRDIQHKVGISTIYVTHDQEEALAVSDRICVMNSGRIEQIGTPLEIYSNPQTQFVASFVGTINFINAGVPGLDVLLNRLGLAAAAKDKAVASWAVRPENLLIEDAATEPQGDGRTGGTLAGEISRYTYIGHEAHLFVTTPFGKLIVHVSNPSGELFASVGRDLHVRLHRSAMLAFDSEGRRVPLVG
jgi:iron(III) transport system ATP-binding protein